MRDDFGDGFAVGTGAIRHAFSEIFTCLVIRMITHKIAGSA